MRVEQYPNGRDQNTIRAAATSNSTTTAVSRRNWRESRRCSRKTRPFSTTTWTIRRCCWNWRSSRKDNSRKASTKRVDLYSIYCSTTVIIITFRISSSTLSFCYGCRLSQTCVCFFCCLGVSGQNLLGFLAGRAHRRLVLSRIGSFCSPEGGLELGWPRCGFDSRFFRMSLADAPLSTCRAMLKSYNLFLKLES